MAQAHPLCSSPSSAFHHHHKSLSFSNSHLFLKFPNFPPSSHPFSPLTLHSETILHSSLQHRLPQQARALNSLQDAKLHDPDAKSSPFSKHSIWVNPKSPRAKHLLNKKSSDDRSPLVKLAKSLDSCNPSEQHVSEILDSLGNNVSLSGVVFILDSMSNPDTALLAVRYFQNKVNPAKHVILYNVTLKLLRKIKDFQRAEKLFDEMLHRGVKPNIITFSTIISCACVCSLPHKAVKLFEMMPSFDCEPDNSVSSTMIYVYARTCNVDKALNFYERAKKEKWHVDIKAFSALIKMHGMCGNYDGCINVYNDMKVIGVKLNLVTYNTLLYAMGRAKRAWKARSIYEEMINNGFLPTWPTYAALLEAYCRARFTEDAMGIYEEMKEKGKDMNLVLYNMIFDMCADVGYADEAVKIFQEMKSSGTCKPDNFTYSSLINMYSCIGNVTEAEAMLNEMVQSGFEPNILVLTSLVHCYGKAKRTDDVVKVFNQLLDLGISPDDRFCDCLLYVMTQIPKEEFGKITNCIEKANPKLGTVVRYLIEEPEDDGDFRMEVSELLYSIHDDVKKSFCNCLIDLCVSLDMQDKARDLLDLGLTLQIYTDMQSRTQTKWFLRLKRLSLGAAMTALHVWIDDLSKALESGEDLPPLLGINTGLGKHKIADKGLANAFESYLKELNAPFHKATDKAGWFMTTKEAAKLWLQSRGSSEQVAALDSSDLGVPTVALP